jgi:hypothetical protein
MPGESPTVHFITQGRIDRFEDKLKILTVADSY